METEKKIEIAKYAISRFDEYYSGINNKGNFYLTIHTIILGSATYFFSDKAVKITLFPSHIVILTLLVIIALTAILLTLFSVNPFLSSGNTEKYSSILFFGSIAGMAQKEFSDQFDKANGEIFYSDIKRQMYQLASGLNRKFSILKWVGRLLIAEFILIAILVLTIITLT